MGSNVTKRRWWRSVEEPWALTGAAAFSSLGLLGFVQLYVDHWKILLRKPSKQVDRTLYASLKLRYVKQSDFSSIYSCLSVFLKLEPTVQMNCRPWTPQRTHRLINSMTRHNDAAILAKGAPTRYCTQYIRWTYILVNTNFCFTKIFFNRSYAVS